MLCIAESTEVLCAPERNRKKQEEKRKANRRPPDAGQPQKDRASARGKRARERGERAGANPARTRDADRRSTERRPAQAGGCARPSARQGCAPQGAQRSAARPSAQARAKAASPKASETKRAPRRATPEARPSAKAAKRAPRRAKRTPLPMTRKPRQGSGPAGPVPTGPKGRPAPQASLADFQLLALRTIIHLRIFLYPSSDTISHLPGSIPAQFPSPWSSLPSPLHALVGSIAASFVLYVPSITRPFFGQKASFYVYFSGTYSSTRFWIRHKKNAPASPALH